MSIVLNPDAGVTTPSPVTLEGSTSGTVTLAAPAISGSTVITFPAVTGTVAITSELEQIGVGQTWQDVQSSRSLGVTYTNTTGKPIMVFASFAEISQFVIYYAVVNGLTIAFGRSPFNGTNGYYAASFIVPDGNTYSFTGPDSVLDWIELR
jgi:hypothetical protein